MSKLHQSFLKGLIRIDRSSMQPVYLQIAEQIAHSIQKKHIPLNTKLPGTRSLSLLLGVNRNTAVAAYEELKLQGWIEMKPNRGAYTTNLYSLKSTPISENIFLIGQTYPMRTGYEFQKTNVLDNPFENSLCDFVFTDGTPDIRLAQLDVLSRTYSANLKRKSNKRKMGDPYLMGSEYFREQLANYLNLSRGLHINEKNLLVSRGAEMGLYVISQTLLAKGDRVVVGSPSYFSANMIFQQIGANIISIRTDHGGIRVDDLEDVCRRQLIRMLYLTPHYHYPTTVTLSADRREQVLELAERYGFIVVEDDYDYDFNYDHKTVLPMASIDSKGMVVYIGSLGKSLAPGFRTGFVVAPEDLLVELRKRMSIIDRQGDILMEQALGELIEEGELTRYIKRSLLIYKDRRDYLAKQLKVEFKDYVDFDLPSGGLALWVRWRSDINLLQVSKRCAEHGLFIPKILLYQSKDTNAMRIGFGHLESKEMDRSLAILKENLNYF